MTAGAVEGGNDEMGLYKAVDKIPGSKFVGNIPMAGMAWNINYCSGHKGIAGR